MYVLTPISLRLSRPHGRPLTALPPVESAFGCVSLVTSFLPFFVRISISVRGNEVHVGSVSAVAVKPELDYCGKHRSVTDHQLSDAPQISRVNHLNFDVPTNNGVGAELSDHATSSKEMIKQTPDSHQKYPLKLACIS